MGYDWAKTTTTRYLHAGVEFGKCSLDKVLGAARASRLKGNVASCASRLSASSATMA